MFRYTMFIFKHKTYATGKDTQKSLGECTNLLMWRMKLTDKDSRSTEIDYVTSRIQNSVLARAKTSLNGYNR